VAQRICLSKVWRAKKVACAAGSLCVQRLPTPSDSDRWNHFPRYPFAVATLVPSHLARDEPKERSYNRALGLQRILGLGSYQTAWTVLHKLRRAMVRPGRDRLSGRVEVDETQIGGPGFKGRGSPTKALVVIAAQEDGKGIGRIRMARIADGSAQHLLGFVQESVVQGAHVHTDGWKPYQGLAGLGYEHEITKLKGLPLNAATETLPRVHRVASLLKRWLLGTHQGAIEHEHLDYYCISTNSRFVSIDGLPPPAGSYFTAWRNKPCRFRRPRIRRSWEDQTMHNTTGSSRWSQ